MIYITKLFFVIVSIMWLKLICYRNQWNGRA